MRRDSGHRSCGIGQASFSEDQDRENSMLPGAVAFKAKPKRRQGNYCEEAGADLDDGAGRTI